MSAGGGEVSGARCGDGRQLVTPVAVPEGEAAGTTSQDAGGAGGGRE